MNMEKKNLWDKISIHLKNMKWLDRNNEICMIFWKKPQVNVDKVINRYYNVEYNVREWLNSLSPEIQQNILNYYRRQFVKKPSSIEIEEKPAPPETRKEKRFIVSSYGVLFEVKVLADHFDQFLLNFIEEGLEGGSGLFEPTVNVHPIWRVTFLMNVSNSMKKKKVLEISLTNIICPPRIRLSTSKKMSAPG